MRRMSSGRSPLPVLACCWSKRKKFHIMMRAVPAPGTAFSATQGGVRTWQGSFKELAFPEMTVD